MEEVTHLRSPHESGAKLGKEAAAPRAKSKAPAARLQRQNQESKKNPRARLEPAGLSTMQLLLSATDSLNNTESRLAEIDCNMSLLLEHPLITATVPYLPNARLKDQTGLFHS